MWIQNIHVIKTYLEPFYKMSFTKLDNCAALVDQFPFELHQFYTVHHIISNARII